MLNRCYTLVPNVNIILYDLTECKLRYNIFVSGYLLFKEFCEQTSEEPVPQLKFYEEVNYYTSGRWMC